MLPDKVIKKKYKPIFWKNPDKYYATSVLKEEGFKRKICKVCKKPFWSVNNQNVCGDSACSGKGYSFIGKKIGSKELSYVDVWKKFSHMFKKKGYEPIKRYPSVARWNPTMEYTNASIAAFQPYIISGEVNPPSDHLAIPQFCLRFSDVDNVGITMSHMTGFVMIGQHSFVQEKHWDQKKMFRDMYDWNTKGLGLKKEDMTFHEDAWAGGGNLGPCMEMFSGGCELWNQVYMMYEQKNSGVRDLKLKVLDMGLGMERNAWFSQGASTIYDATFPKTLKKVLSKEGVKIDKKILEKYSPYGGFLNNDEVDDMNKAWNFVEKKVGKGVKDKIKLWSKHYFITEHARSLLFAINDGALPSNTGGGYNLRMMARRCLAYSNKNEISEICEWHANELKDLFPELKENIESVKEVLDIEKKKYASFSKETKRLVANLDLKKLKENDLLKLYDSKGINPEMIPGVKIPNDFYAKVSELHEKKAVQKAEVKNEINFGSLTNTEALYYDNYDKVKFKGQVLRVVKDLVVLDKTAFYPSSGGQVHDFGSLGGCEVLDIWKQGSLIVHKVKDLNFKKGDLIEGLIDRERRIQLSQHHTAAHIVNAAARKILGRHVNQAGAYKDVEKARLDITHFDSLSQEEVRKIEDEANKIIKKEIVVESKFYPRSEAEKMFGMEIYHGGAVPGRMLRIVNIKGVDVEACGGTHLKNTKDVEKIKIIKSSKIQDGVVRLVFVAGKAAMKEEESKGEVVDELMKLLNCKREEVPGRCSELFSLWKKVVKKKKDVEKKLVSDEKFKGDVLLESSKRLKTQPEHVVKTVKRFMNELSI